MMNDDDYDPCDFGECGDDDDNDRPDNPNPESEECEGDTCDICGKFISTSQGEGCEMCLGHEDDHNICNPNSIAYNPMQCRNRCDAVQTLWNNSFAYGMRETGAFILYNGGYLIFDNSGNGAHNLHIPNFVMIDGLAYAIMPDGNAELIAGIIHTHPDSDPSYFQGPTVYYDGSVDDFTSLEQLGGRLYNNFYGYVISTDSAYRYYFDDYGNKVVEQLGSRSSFSECP